MSADTDVLPEIEAGANAAPPLHLVLIDGSGFIFRAYHALPPMTRPDGTPVNAVFSGSPTCWPSCCASMSAPTSR